MGNTLVMPVVVRWLSVGCPWVTPIGSTHGYDLITALRFKWMVMFICVFRLSRIRGYRYIRWCCHVRGFYHIPWVVDPRLCSGHAYSVLWSKPRSGDWITAVGGTYV